MTTEERTSSGERPAADGERTADLTATGRTEAADGASRPGQGPRWRTALAGVARRLRLPGSARGWLAFLGAFWPFILGAVLVSGGLAAIILGYLGAAGTLYVGLQVPYVVSGGLLGLGLVVLGSALMVVQVMTRHTRLLRRLLEEQRARPREDDRMPPHGELSDGRAEDGMVVVAAGAKRFHRPGCLLVQGKAVQRLEPGAAASKGLQACRVCDPERPA